MNYSSVVKSPAKRFKLQYIVLCNDITSGLPAEIEARQKQYEFHRDKLLTFQRKDEA